MGLLVLMICFDYRMYHVSILSEAAVLRDTATLEKLGGKPCRAMQSRTNRPWTGWSWGSQAWRPLNFSFGLWSLSTSKKTCGHRLQCHLRLWNFFVVTVQSQRAAAEPTLSQSASTSRMRRTEGLTGNKTHLIYLLLLVLRLLEDGIQHFST